MKYSKMASAIPASPIRDMMVRAAAMEDVVSFAVGEPDFVPVKPVLEAGKAALDRCETKYAPGAGISALRETYAAYLSEQVGIPYSASQVVVTVGGMASLFLGLMCTVDRGDEVLVSAPYFSNYAQMVSMCHGTLIPVDVREEDAFVLSAEAVRKAITPKSKVLMINSPCNPTGGVISRTALEELSALAVEHDLIVISDEVYRHILFDGEEYVSIASLPGMAERTLIVDSCSKTFAMTGFRIGFGAGPEELIRLMIKLTEGVYSAAGTMNQYAALEAFHSALPHCREMTAEYQRRRDYLVGRLNATPGIRCITPKGAFYVFANISGTGLKAKDFCNRLLDQAHVAVVPGDNFGLQGGDRYVRISYATSMENIEKGCDRIEAFCNTLV